MHVKLSFVDKAKLVNVACVAGPGSLHALRASRQFLTSPRLAAPITRAMLDVELHRVAINLYLGCHGHGN